jgi:hypothetical protein
VVKTVLEGSKQATNEELQRWYKDETVIQSWRKNPLGDFMTVLAGALETESKSAESRRKEKERVSKRPTLSEPPSGQTLHELNIPRIAIDRYHATYHFRFIFNVYQYTRTSYLST